MSFAVHREVARQHLDRRCPGFGPVDWHHDSDRVPLTGHRLAALHNGL